MGKIKSQTHIVCDAGPIIHLDELDCLYLLEDFEKVVVPEVVRREVLQHSHFSQMMRQQEWQLQDSVTKSMGQ